MAERSLVRRAFLQQWQYLYALEPRRIAPHYRQRQILHHPARDPYLVRAVQAMIRLAELPKRQPPAALGELFWKESIVAVIPQSPWALGDLLCAATAGAEACIGPVSPQDVGTALLLHHGAQIQQGYRLYTNKM